MLFLKLEMKIMDKIANMKHLNCRFNTFHNLFLQIEQEQCAPQIDFEIMFRLIRKSRTRHQARHLAFS